jgi:hypothetical protein
MHLRLPNGSTAAYAYQHSYRQTKKETVMLRTLVRSLVAAFLPVTTLLAFGTSSIMAMPAPPPPTMTTETLAATSSPSDLFDFPCAIGSFTVPFDVSGTATGPYTGTFEETGTLSYTINPPYATSNSGTVTAFSATFTITSDTGTVTGSKVLDPSATPGTVTCGRHSSTAGFIVSGIPTTYTATIGTPNGNYHDEGTSGVDLSWSRGGQYGQITRSTFAESFQSTLAEPILIVPTSVDDCKNGGWQNFPQFTNQGQCVSFVAQQQGGDAGDGEGNS